MPRFALWENVAGLLTSKHVDDFNSALQHFAKLGAMDIAWRVLDAQGFGTPQRRRRVFSLVDFGGFSAGEVLFEPPGSQGNPDQTGASRQAKEGPGAGAPSSSLASRLTGAHKGDGWSGVCPTICSSDRVGVWSFCGNGYLENLTKDVAPTLKSATKTAFTIDYGGGRGYNHVSEELSPTLVTIGPHALSTGSDVLRFLTPVECERLMSWPDGWTAQGVDQAGREVDVSDAQRYRMCGNGVVSNVAEWVGRRLLDVTPSPRPS